jgi:hypothetical protein
MKAIALKTLLLAMSLSTPLALIPDASADRGGSRSGSSHSSDHSSSGHSSSHNSSHSYGHSRSYGSSHNSYSPSRYSSYGSSRHYYPSSHYRPSSNFSISIGSGYYGSYYGSGYGGYYNSLPFGYSSCVVGGLTYYTHGSRYYRPYNTGYVIVSDPYVSVPRTRTVVTRTVSNKYEDYPRIWVNGQEFLIDEGELFKITSNGLVWSEITLGAVASSLPTHASSVWYKEVEYYEAGGLYFQRVPEGYRIIRPPWDGEY